jgi:Acetyltransferase (GNAT) domain
VDRFSLASQELISLRSSEINKERADCALIKHEANNYNKTHISLKNTQNLRVETLSIKEAQAKLQDWNDLVQRCLEPNIFHEPCFILAATCHLPVKKQPFFIFIWQDNFQDNFEINTPSCLIGVFPFTVSKLDAFAPVLRSWDNVNTALATPLLDKSQADNVMIALFDHVEQTHYKNILFPKIIEKSLFSQTLKRVTAARKRKLFSINTTSRALLKCNDDGQSYIQNNWRSKKLKELNRQRRRLSDIAPVINKVINSLPDINYAIERYLALEVAGWKGRNGTALSQKSGQAHFAKHIMQSLIAENKIEIHELYCGKNLIASGILLKSIGASYFWKITHDEAFAKFSPGVLLTQNLTQHCLSQSDATNIDSCAITDHPMINSLWIDRISINNLMVSISTYSPILSQFAHLREKLRHNSYQFLRSIYIKLKRAKNN